MPSKPSSKYQSKFSVTKHSWQSRSKPRITEVDNWSETTQPEERRRIQNRNAQRKFRQKARDHKETVEREAQNMRLANRSYQIPTPADFGHDPGNELDLPWGSFSMRHIVARGLESTNMPRGGNDFVFLSSQRDPRLGSQRENTVSWRQPACDSSSGVEVRSPCFEEHQDNQAGEDQADFSLEGLSTPGSTGPDLRIDVDLMAFCGPSSSLPW